MKIKQLFTSFLACMALWSVPVYATIEDDVYTKYTEFTEDKKDYGLANAYKAPTIDNPSVEQLKDNMDKKKDILDQAKKYQKSIKAFDEKYATYLTDLKKLIDKADNENKRAQKRAARGNARSKMEALILNRPVAFQKVVGITQDFVRSISSKLREKEIEKDVTKMKDRYNKEITNAKSDLVKEENNLAGIIAGHQTAYDKALEAYNYKKTKADLDKAIEANKKAEEARKKSKRSRRKSSRRKSSSRKSSRRKSSRRKSSSRKSSSRKRSSRKRSSRKRSSRNTETDRTKATK
jgi:hypothetical protein